MPILTCLIVALNAEQAPCIDCVVINCQVCAVLSQGFHDDIGVVLIGLECGECIINVQHGHIYDLLSFSCLLSIENVKLETSRGSGRNVGGPFLSGAAKLLIENCPKWVNPGDFLKPVIRLTEQIILKIPL